jgi:hypothetical protein
LHLQSILGITISRSSMEPTLCPAIIICDGIIQEAGTGKLTCIGTFQFYNAPQFPFVIPGFAVLAMVDNLQAGLKDAKVTVRVESMDSGHTLASAVANVTMTEGYDSRGSLDVPFRFPPMTFPAPGLYQIVVLFNNEQLGTRRLLVRPLTSQNPIK